jgi:hypothetical protein
MSERAPKARGRTQSAENALGAIIREARTISLEDVEALTARPLDWKKVEKGLFSRIERDAANAAALAAYKGQPLPWLVLGGIASLAAAAALILAPAAGTTSPLAKPILSGAGELAFQAGAGEVRVNQAKAGAGAHVGEGASIETHGAKGIFDAPGRVSWLIEDRSRLVVERARSGGGSVTPIILSLSKGAVEAQVAPVSFGEAFAVDVGAARVAVHGTHLRVARDGDHVVVDLTEGVVSIGSPPKVGSTYGRLVTAPAHVEFQASDVDGSMVVEHDPDAIRGATDIMNPAPEGVPASSTVRVVPEGAGPTAHLEQPPIHPAARAPAKSEPKEIARDPNAEETIRSAVTSCMQQYWSTLPVASDMKKTLDTVLALEVKDDGFVNSPHATFDPPVVREVNECAAEKIYRVRFTTAGPREVVIHLTQP